MSRTARNHRRTPATSMGSAAHDAARGATFEATARSLDALRAAQDGAGRVSHIAEVWGNSGTSQVAGRMAEELHAATFNIDAASKGLRGLKATTTASQGAGGAAADVSVTRMGEVLDRAQLKFRDTAARTTSDVANVKYDGMQRVVPADQVDRVKSLAKKRGIDGLGKRNYPETAKGAADRVRAGGAESQPLTRDQALAAAKDPSGTAKALVSRQAVDAVKNGAVAGAAIGGGISAVTNLVAWADGEKDGEEALLDVAKDTAACGLSGAATSAAAVAAETALVRAGAGALARGAAPVAIGLTVVDVGKDLGRLCTGDIDGGEFAERSAGHVVKGGIVWGAAEGGAALGTAICPGIGTVIGGLAGGILGGLFGGALFD
jgi:hypothetical protein